MNRVKYVALVFFAASFLFWSCDHGQLGDADRTDTYFPGDARYEERMDFFDGVWYSYYAGIGRLDGYRIRKWNDFTDVDRAKAQALFPGLSVSSPRMVIKTGE